MKTKFTKGEWILNSSICEIVSENDCSRNDGIDVIAVCFGRFGDTAEEALANAKLVAAAPDMYNALSKLVEEIETLIEFTSEQGIIDWEDDCIEGVANMKSAKKMAIEALKKATE